MAENKGFTTAYDSNLASDRSEKEAQKNVIENATSAEAGEDPALSQGNFFHVVLRVFRDRNRLEFPECEKGRGQAAGRKRETTSEDRDQTLIAEFCRSGGDLKEANSQTVSNPQLGESSTSGNDTDSDTNGASKPTELASECIALAVAHTASCRAYDKSGFHSQPRASCEINVATGSDQRFFAHSNPEVVHPEQRAQADLIA